MPRGWEPFGGWVGGSVMRVEVRLLFFLSIFF